MQWKLEDTPKRGVSEHGWRRKTVFRPGTRLVWSEEEREAFTDLHALARTWSFSWATGKMVDLPNPGAGSVIDRLANGQGLSLVLAKTLNDIAQVASAKGFKPPASFTATSNWSLGGGELEVFFMRPSAIANDGTGSGFGRVCFLLKIRPQHGQEARNFYQWGLRATNKVALDVTLPIKDWGMNHLQQVHNKVWIATNARGQRAALKFEISQNVDRFGCTNFLASHVFDGTAANVLADAGDITAIKGAHVRNGATYVPSDPEYPPPKLPAHGELLDCIRVLSPPTGSLLCKIEYKPGRPNVQDQLNALNKGPADARAAGLLAIHQGLFVKRNFRRFGKMAVFDIVVSNGDRLRPLKDGENFELQVNNFDFDNAGQPVALDNFDPNPKDFTPDTWNGYLSTLATSNKVSYYARRVIDQLVERTEAYGFLQANARKRLEDAFVEGVTLGKLTLVAFLVAQGRTLQSDFGESGREVHRRIMMLQD
ncbi:hypothetical protein [Siccirubricoccus sp. G192]|uniref:hypothetical protein n=1 Tax=Siccirubricoccus sp. G192 TaxID=2849651 RepID=UPI001C2C1DFC|nr:hypothetical protein [Siccirubricoccus sp. G192]MBV1800067.1 hypothetical protein [Siccirubricoccus sp. G192]